MECWFGKVAIVTGAGTGIGEAVSDSLVKYGVKVVGVGRREEKLKEVEKKLSGGKGKFYPVKADITKEEDIFNVFKWAETNLGAVHIMINNAGVIDIKKVEEQETEVWRQMYETNVISLQIFCREAVKSMKKNNVKDGFIINISSVVATMSSPSPRRSTYFASKKAANAFTEGLRVELANERSDIRVTTINPGLTDTDILKPYREEIPEEIVKLAMKPSDVAETVVLVLQLPPNVVVPELTVQPIRSIKLESQKLRQGKLEQK